MRMLKENFEAALTLAIEHRKAQEAQISPTYESTFTAGLKSILEASRKGERIVIEST